LFRIAARSSFPRFPKPFKSISKWAVIYISTTKSVSRAKWVGGLVEFIEVVEVVELRVRN
jgi:hypothetical protein